MNQEQYKKLSDHFIQKSELKQLVYRQTLETFSTLKTSAENIIGELKKDLEEQKSELDLYYSNIGSYEAEMRFAGDALLLQMHTNVFAFPEEHFIYNSNKVQADVQNGYFGMILIYNFLADSLRFNRFADVGYLLGRIFVNKDMNFFVQGRRQLSFLYQDFDNQFFNENVARDIVQNAMGQAIDFDLFVPPFDDVKEVTLQQRIVQQGNTAIKTGKRLGFIYNSAEGET
ncbi:MAG: hypothetical protein KDC92_01935 [Bacteroidetes bacterium]|nr:hypothetical protein [Bacteroidota bacterium]